MSDRVERKLQEVIVAQYTWRHEAEFAAGFLRDAGIPYRLQIDDPSLGLAVSAAATLWVLGADEARARDVLDLNEQHKPRLSSPRSANHPKQSKPARPTSRKPAHSVGATPRRSDRGEQLATGRRSRTPMTPRTRIVSVLGSMGIAGLGRVVFGPGIDSAGEVVVAAIAVMLALVGLVGWAPRALRDFLDSIAGGEL